MAPLSVLISMLTLWDYTKERYALSQCVKMRIRSTPSSPTCLSQEAKLTFDLYVPLTCNLWQGLMMRIIPFWEFQNFFPVTVCAVFKEQVM